PDKGIGRDRSGTSGKRLRQEPTDPAPARPQTATRTATRRRRPGRRGGRLAEPACPDPCRRPGARPRRLPGGRGWPVTLMGPTGFPARSRAAVAIPAAVLVGAAAAYWRGGGGGEP